MRSLANVYTERRLHTNWSQKGDRDGDDVGVRPASVAIHFCFFARSLRITRHAAAAMCVKRTTVTTTMARRRNEKPRSWGVDRCWSRLGAGWCFDHNNVVLGFVLGSENLNSVPIDWWMGVRVWDLIVKFDYCGLRVNKNKPNVTKTITVEAE